MKKKETLLQAIIAFLLGHRYYANIINTRGTDRTEISSYIFHSREEAEQHRRSLDDVRSYLFVETVAFRSRNEY